MNIVICSHGRPEDCKRKTLNFLRRMEVPDNIVTIYCSNAEQLRWYERTIGGGYLYLIGGGSLREKRNHILLSHQPGEQLICFDDDVKDIFRRNDDVTWNTPRAKQSTSLTPSMFRTMVTHGFGACEDAGAFMWGLQPTSNPQFCKPKVSVGLKFLCGAVYGIIVRHDSDLLTHYNFKEDFERTMRHYEKDGAVVRLDQYGIITTYFSHTGGTASQGFKKRFTLMNREIDLLVHEFPHLCKPIQKRLYRDLKLFNLKKIL